MPWCTLLHTLLPPGEGCPASRLTALQPCPPFSRRSGGCHDPSSRRGTCTTPHTCHACLKGRERTEELEGGGNGMAARCEALELGTATLGRQRELMSTKQGTT